VRNTRDRHGHTSGFTLVEMLTVIIIVGLLLAIGTPTVLRMQLQSIRTASLATLGTIGTAVDMYKTELGVYPPSERDGVAYGRHRLVWALIGYRSAAEDKLDGPGFKISAIGKQYGPYGGTERIDTIGDPANDTISFVDGFRQEVFYYCGWGFVDHDGDANTPEVYEFKGYTAADNGDKGPADLAIHAKTTQATPKWYRKDFLLMTKGPDGIWKPITADDATTDDITNFLSEN
jgi:prepilin-type N-terminal cleavage/methylation domain-containing protein